MASSSTVAKVALDKVAWEFVQDECESKSKDIKRLKDQIKDQEDQIVDALKYIDSLEARFATILDEKLEMSNNLDAAREEVARLRFANSMLESENGRLQEEAMKVARFRFANSMLESENDRLREEAMSAQPAKILRPTRG